MPEEPIEEIEEPTEPDPIPEPDPEPVIIDYSDQLDLILLELETMNLEPETIEMTAEPIDQVVFLSDEQFNQLQNDLSIIVHITVFALFIFTISIVYKLFWRVFGFGEV